LSSYLRPFDSPDGYKAGEFFKMIIQLNVETYPGASVQTDVDGAAEQDEVAFRELEGAETGRDEIAVHCVEVLEQVRVH